MPKRITRTARERDKEAVEIIRKLKGIKKPFRWHSYEVKFGASVSMHGIDIEKEIMEVMCADIARTIDEEMLRGLSGKSY